MKKIRITKQFAQNYKIRIKKDRILNSETIEAIDLFLEDPNNPILRNHILVGNLKGKKSFSVTDDLRIIYVETKSFYIFIDIGNHNEVY